MITVAKEGEEIYRSESVPAGELELTAADLGQASLSKEASYTVTVAVNPVAGYLTSEAVTANVAKPFTWGSGEPSGASSDPEESAEASGEPASDEAASDETAGSELTETASAELNAEIAA